MALNVYIKFTNSTTEKTRSLLTGLLAFDVPQAIQIFQLILNSWFKGEKETLRKYLGDVAESDFVGGRLLYTLSPDGQQFRAWYGIPGTISHKHVDSCGSGDLYTIEGNKDELAQLILQLLTPYILQTEIVLPGGAKVYGLRWEWR